MPPKKVDGWTGAGVGVGIFRGYLCFRGYRSYVSCLYNLCGVKEIGVKEIEHRIHHSPSNHTRFPWTAPPHRREDRPEKIKGVF